MPAITAEPGGGSDGSLLTAAIGVMISGDQNAGRFGQQDERLDAAGVQGGPAGQIAGRHHRQGVFDAFADDEFSIGLQDTEPDGAAGNRPERLADGFDCGLLRAIDSQISGVDCDRSVLDVFDKSDHRRAALSALAVPHAPDKPNCGRHWQQAQAGPQKNFDECPGGRLRRIVPDIECRRDAVAAMRPFGFAAPSDGFGVDFVDLAGGVVD